MSVPHASQTIMKEVEQQVRAAVKQVVQSRKSEGFYKDDEDSSKRHYFTTLEGLEAILIPSLALGYDATVAAVPDITPILEEDIKYVLSFNDGDKRKRKNQGKPYFVTGRGAGKEYYWLSECATFTLSTLINVLLVAKLRPTCAPRFAEEALNTAVTKNLKDILDCQAPSGGWAWSTREKDADAWATWSIIETLSDYLSYSDKAKVNLPSPKKVKASLEKAAAYLSEQLDLAERDSLSSCWRRDVFARGIMRSNTHVKLSYAFVQTMISASLVGLHKHKNFMDLACNLFESVDKVNVRRVENSVRVATRKADIQDYSFHATLLRALTSLYVQMTPTNRKLLQTRLPRSIEYYVRKQYDNLSANYILDGDWRGLWGHHKTYEVYYTERSLEALVSLLEFASARGKLEEHWVILQPKKLTRADLRSQVEKAKRHLSQLSRAER